MLLDRNRIVIRRRGYADVLDLALRVVRAYALPLAKAFAVGVLPALVLNAWLLAGYASPLRADDGSPDFSPFFYMWWMLLLVLWEAPLATAAMTLYLGQALFLERPEPAKIARSLLKSLPQLILYQVVLRGLLLLIVLTWPIVFAAWPYFSEVILLEQNPLRARRPGQMTSYRRMQVLHAGSFGDSLVRWLAGVAVGSLLFVSIWLSLWTGIGTLLNQWWSAGPFFTVYYPLALWTVVGFFTVVRFLSYLDLRIRREGWEVELMLRAEEARLTRQLT